MRTLSRTIVLLVLILGGSAGLLFYHHHLSQEYQIEQLKAQKQELEDRSSAGCRPTGGWPKSW